MNGYSIKDVLYANRHDKYTPFPKDSNTSMHQDDVTIIDDDWLVNRFMASDVDLTNVDRQNRYFSSAKWKTFDTSLGNHIAINPKPQFTRYCDIRGGARGLTSEVTVNSASSGSGVRFGMGRYYSEAIDDNYTLVYLQFGVAKFNSIINYFTKAVDGLSLYAAKHGRLPNEYLYNGGKYAGYGFMLLAFPLCTTLVWALKWGANMLKNTGNPFSYYYLDKAMHLYWGTVNTLVNNFANESGLFTTILQKETSDKIGVPYKVDAADWNALSEAFPGIFRKDTQYIDVFAIATRGQAIANRVKQLEYTMYVQGLSKKDDFLGYAKGANDKSEYKSPGSTKLDAFNKYFSVDTFLNDSSSGVQDLVNNARNFVNSSYTSFLKIMGDFLKYDGGINSSPNNPSSENNTIADGDTKDKDKDEFFKSNNESMLYDGKYVTKAEQNDEETRAKLWQKFIEDAKDINNSDLSTVDSVWRDGGEWAVFAVEYQGSVSESFSNSTSQIETGGILKSVAKGVHDFRFNSAGLNISDAVNDVVKSVGQVASGILEGVTLGFSNVVQTLLGAYVDMPLKWEDSSSSFTSANYKMKLISPYGNPISQLQNIYIPLFMLIAGTLPLGVGNYAYTSPFLCSLYNKGVQNIKLGMITSLSITRGTSNLPFSKNKKPLALDVSFSVTDFSNLLTTPINKGMVSPSDIFMPVLQHDTNISRYIETLASRDLLTNKYLGPKFRLLANRLSYNTASWLSQNTWGFRVGEMLNSSPAAMFVNDMEIGITQLNPAKQ